MFLGSFAPSAISQQYFDEGPKLFQPVGISGAVTSLLSSIVCQYFYKQQVLWRDRSSERPHSMRSFRSNSEPPAYSALSESPYFCIGNGQTFPRCSVLQLVLQGFNIYLKYHLHIISWLYRARFQSCACAAMLAWFGICWKVMEMEWGEDHYASDNQLLRQCTRPQVRKYDTEF